VRKSIGLIAAITLVAGLFGAVPATAAETQMVTDGDFEANVGDWSESSGGGFPLVTTAADSGKPARSGTHLVWLCGYNDCNDTLSQSLSIPIGATSGTLNFWMLVVTEESPSATCFDMVVVKLNDAALGNPICNTEASGSYVAKSRNITSIVQANPGSTLELRFDATSDENLNTNFLLDDVTATVTSTDEPIVHTRSLTLTMKKHLKATGTLSSETDPCFVGRDVKVQKRRKDGTWATLATALADVAGFFKAPVPDKTGRYRAVAPLHEIAEGETCAKATSPIRQHSH
jgi:hypothetical protein